jgi:TPP-dependent pyruvate/acetoin dehydrogenase alpha subunit
VKDPIGRLKNFMILSKIIQEEELLQVDQEAKQLVSEAVEFARNGHPAPDESAFQDLYSDPDPRLVPKGW